MQDSYADTDRWQLPHILAYCSFGICVCLTVVLFVLVRKVRGLLTILTLKHLPAVDSASTFLSWPDPNDPLADADFRIHTNPDPTLSLTQVDYIIIALQAFSCILLITVLGIHLRQRLNAISYSSKVVLELCGATSRISIPLCAVAKCPGDYCIPNPTWLQSLNIVPKLRFWSHLHLDWPQLALKDKKTCQEVAIPRTVRLSVWETVVTKRILVKPYTAFLKIQHGDIAMYLRKPSYEVNGQVQLGDPGIPATPRRGNWAPDSLYPAIGTLPQAQ